MRDTATVASADDEAVSTNVTVFAEAAFAVDFVDVTDPVEGEMLNVTVAVENVGDVEDTQTIILDVSGLGGDSTEVTLGGADSTEEMLTIATTDGDNGTYTATVASNDDTDETTVQVLSDSAFLVEIVDSTTPVEGDNLTVTADIENTGDDEATQTVELNVPDLGGDQTTVSLSGGESTEETMTVTTGAGDAGEYTATVSSDDDSASAGVNIKEPTELIISNLTAPAEAAPGTEINVTATVTNIGGVAGGQDVEFRFNGTAVANTTVSLNASANTTVEFSPTLPDQTGTFEHGVFTNDDSQTAQISLEDPGPPSLPGSEDPPQDPDDDGDYEDIDGDGAFDIFDVQALFNGLNSDAVQNNPEAFNFNEDDKPEDVSIFDVQGLFNDL